MAKSKSVMTQVSGTSHLKINKMVDSDQLLVTVSRNGKEWLSPVGWVEQEKGTLLDCQVRADHTVVEIPAEFAKNLKSGDTINLHSRELDFKGSIDWNSPGSADKPAKKANGAAPMKAISLEETEKRAKEAEKRAASYRTQMEAAAKAREAAQAAALEAARKADEALKAEADRIAEMEQAAKAFEEAERARMEEQRRLDRERRLEEERKAEEARLAEEARVKAEAERLKKERSQARKFFKGEIATTKAEKSRLQEVLAGFKARAETAESNIADGDKRLSRIEKSLAAAQKEEASTKATLSREESRIGELKSHKDTVQTSIQDLEKGNDKLFKSLEKANQAHEKALSEVEAAKTRAAEALKNLSSVKAQTDKVKSQKDSLMLERRDAEAKLSAHEKHLGELKSAHDKARLATDNEQTSLKTLKKNREDLDQKLSGAKTDIARTLQDIKSVDDTLSRQQTSLKQVEDMENADDIRKIAGKSAIAKPPAGRAKPAITTTNSATETEESGGFLRRFFRKSGQDKVNVPAGVIKPEPSSQTQSSKPPARPVAKANETPKSVALKSAKPIETHIEAVPPKETGHRENGRGASGYRLNSWLLMGIAVTSIAAIGTAYAMSGKSDTKLEAGKTAVKTEVKVLALKELTTETTQMAEVAIAPETLAEKPALQDTPEVRPAALETGEKSAERPKTADAPKPTAKPPATKPPAPKPKAVSASPKPAAPSASAKIEPQPNYEAATRQVQEQLTFLGFYTGDINGQQTVQTQEAMQEFKSLYGLPNDNRLTGAFLNTLKRTYEEQTRARSAALSEPVMQVAENTLQVPSLDVQPIAASTSLDVQAPTSIEQEVLENAALNPAPVQSGTVAFRPTPNPVISEPEPTPEPEPVQLAELTAAVPATVIETPVEDTIVPVKVIRKARVEYPSRLLQKNKYYDAKVYVTYDVSLDGRAENPEVSSMEFDGSELEKNMFRKAAVNAVKSQRFSPKTVNGEAVMTEDRTTRIWFNVEQ